MHSEFFIYVWNTYFINFVWMYKILAYTEVFFFCSKANVCDVCITLYNVILDFGIEFSSFGYLFSYVFSYRLQIDDLKYYTVENSNVETVSRANKEFHLIFIYLV